jgi:branched-chain amino acid transport system substrate-binding protein
LEDVHVRRRRVFLQRDEVFMGAAGRKTSGGKPMQRSIMIIGAAFAATIAAGTAAAQAQYTGGTVKIGVMNDMSGVYSDIAGMGSVVATKKAIADFGAEAKGMKVEVLFADHLNKPDVGASIARKWIDVDKVDVIVDVPTSSVALAVNEIVRDNNKVFLVSGAATSDLTGPKCSPNTVHWTYDTWALANGTGTAIVKNGGDTWFFVTADYAFGHALERDTAAVVEANGGKVLGRVRHPFPGSDFSSFLLQAQASKAKVIGLANAGGDTINAIKQAADFGIGKGGQTIAGLLVFINDVHALGLNVAQGLTYTGAWYWDMNDNNRAFAKEYFAELHRMPAYTVAGVYSSVFHYLKAIAALNAHNDGAAVVAKMKQMPTDDKLYGKGSIREDGRKIHDMYLFEVKKPEESKYPWDYLKVKATIPAAQAWRPLDQGHCPFLKKS